MLIRKLFKLFLPLIFFICCHPTAYAQNGCCAPTLKNSFCSCECLSPWYVLVGGGFSNSRRAGITVNLNIWDFAQQGYDNNLGNASLWYAGCGYNFYRFLRFDVSGTHRGDYKYSKFQTGSSSTPGFTGNQRTRKFKLDSNSIMLSTWLDGDKISPYLKWGSDCISVTPFVGGGIGIDYQIVQDFHTIGNVFVDSSGNIRNETPSVNSYTTGGEFSWHLAAGLAAHITPKAKVEVGYNYFDGGHIPFPDYIGGTTSTPRNFATVTPWHGKLRSNEVFAELQISL